MREGSAMRSTASQSIADSRIGVQRGVPLHRSYAGATDGRCYHLGFDLANSA
jgi:hypothetical protein